MDKSKENIVFMDRTYNTECPICFEKENLTPLSCFHLIHLECAKNLISLVCPICDAPLEDLPDEVQMQIRENEREYKDELEEEDRQAIQSDIERRRSMISRMEMVLQPPPNIEILAAIQDARSMGIPLSCIPTEMRVNVPQGTPSLRGTWYQITLGQAMERARTLLGRQEEDSDDDCTESDPDDDEDPFEEENKLLEKLPRELEFHDNSRQPHK
jgi:hypothetical protein